MGRLDLIFKARHLGRRHPRIAWTLVVLGFVALALVVYRSAPQLPFVGDARYLTYQNAFNQDASGLLKMWTSDYFGGAVTGALPARSGYYRPITNTFYWVEVRLFGERDHLYVLSEILLHGLNGFLVFLLCFRIAGNRLGAAIAGIFFVLHPVHAFAATEPAARADVLFPVFYILALFPFISALQGDEGKAWKITLTTFLYLLSVLSKEMGITLPAILVLLVLYSHFKDGGALRRLSWTIPAWVTLGAYLVWRFIVVDVGTQTVGYGERYSVMALTLGALRGIVIHISRILLPLGPTYPQLNPWLANFVGSPFSNPLTYMALVVVAALAALALSWKWKPLLAFWSAFFLITFSPLLSIDSIAGAVGHNALLTEERWIYLPAVAVAAVVGMGIAHLARSPQLRAPRPAFAAAVLAVLLLLGWSASTHAGRHADPLARLRRLYLLPEARLDRMDRANKLMLYATWVAAPMWRLEEAEARARAALELVPDSPISAAALANILLAREKWEEVVALLTPWLSPTRAELEAVRETNFRIADDFNRMAPQIPFMLARAHAHLGDQRGALKLLCEALRRGYDRQEIAEAEAQLPGVDLLRLSYDATACA